jgi:hypothetical protein
VYPCQTNTVWFKRKLGASERKILLIAGRGDLTQGWNSLLEIYQKLWNNGYRPKDDLDDFLGVAPSKPEKPVVGGFNAV